MTLIAIFDLIAAERATGRPFAIATVIRTADATSAKAGAKALVTASGEVRGHLGGACVTGAVKRAAAEALASGAVATIRVKPAGAVIAAIDPDGAAVHRSGCPSGGTVDLLIEPFLPPPLVAVAGETPVAEAIAAVAAAAGFRVARGIPPGLEPRDFAVVATQGRGDADALRAALLSPAGHVAMVASRRKAAVLTARLRAEGIADERAARLKAPAGLDLGGVDPEEIAVSVVAEIVQVRSRARRQAAATQQSGSAAQEASAARVAAP